MAQGNPHEASREATAGGPTPTLPSSPVFSVSRNEWAAAQLTV